jgi:hypothetical protein
METGKIDDGKDADGPRLPGQGGGEAGAKPPAQQSCAREESAADLHHAKLDASRGATQLNQGLVQSN